MRPIDERRDSALANRSSACHNRDRQICRIVTGRGAAWLARLLGVQEVVGSNPAVPIRFANREESRERRKENDSRTAVAGRLPNSPRSTFYSLLSNRSKYAWRSRSRS